VLKVYGPSRSRTFRTLWMLEELGLPYEQVALDLAAGENRAPAFTAINPNGRVPAIQDGTFTLWESLAINLYLALQHGAASGLWPAAAQDQGRCLQWSFWATHELEPPLFELIQQRLLLPEAERQESRALQAEQRLAAPLGVLDHALQGRAYLLGSEFSVADLNVASVLGWARVAHVDLGAIPRAADWLGRCMARPSARRARAR